MAFAARISSAWRGVRPDRRGQGSGSDRARRTCRIDRRCASIQRRAHSRAAPSPLLVNSATTRRTSLGRNGFSITGRPLFETNSRNAEAGVRFNISALRDVATILIAAPGHLYDVGFSLQKRDGMLVLTVTSGLSRLPAALAGTPAAIAAYARRCFAGTRSTIIQKECAS